MIGNPEGAISPEDEFALLFEEGPDEAQEADDDEAEPEPDEGTQDEAETDEAGDDDEDEGNDEGDEPEDDPEFEIDTPTGKKTVKKSEIQTMYARVAELEAGNLRQADYTRKTMEVAEARREVAQIKQQLSEALQWWAVPTEQEPNWFELAQTLDSQKYNATRAQWEQRIRQAEAAKKQLQQLTAYEKQQKRIAETQRLLEIVPEWRDPEVYDAVARKLVEGARAYGLTPEEVISIEDHRQVLILRDALEMRALRAKGPAAAKKVAKPNVSLKPGAKPNQMRSREADRQKALQRLRQTGSDEAAIDLLLMG